MQMTRHCNPRVEFGIHTAIRNGESYTLDLSGWCTLTGKRRSTVQRLMREGYSKNKALGIHKENNCCGAEAKRNFFLYSLRPTAL